MLDLGEHRLKDFAEPEWLFQLGRTGFPPLRTISNTNLPRPVSSFIGRTVEVAEVVSLVRGGARLVTLSGPGGVGKTRLAVETAADLVADYRNGVFWVRLAALRDPTLVAETVAQTLGAREGLACSSRGARAAAGAGQLRAGSRGGAGPRRSASVVPQSLGARHEQGGAEDRWRGRISGSPAIGGSGGRAPSVPVRSSKPTRWSHPFAGGSTTCLLRLSSPLLGRLCCHRVRSSTDSPIVLICYGAAGTRRLGSRPFGRPWCGRTSCCPSSRDACSHASPSSRGAAR